MTPALSDLERLTAIEDIKRLRALRDRAADTKDYALYESLHAPDHHSYNGDYPPWTTAAEMIANVRKIMENLTTMHHCHTPYITFESSARASGVWAMKGFSQWRQGEDEHSFLGFGHYYETYEKRHGAWLFTSRRLKYIHTITSPGGIFPPPALKQ